MLNKIQLQARITQQGALVMNNQNMKIYQSLMRRWAGKEIILTIEEKKNRRSLRQNAYYWGVVIPLIAEYTGYSENDIHDLLKTMFLKKYIVLNGKEKTIIRSTSELTTAEFAEYLKKIVQWAWDKLQIVIPEPEKYPTL